VQPVSNGITVTRRYLDADGLPVTSAHVGDTITVELTVITRTSLHYFVLEDFYPAGADAVNTRLLTTPSTDSPLVSISRQPDSYWGWGWWFFSYVELRDERAVFSAESLSSGTYVLSYTVRLGVPGEYHVLPASAFQFYYMDIYGYSGSTVFTVLP